jgi:hypothetical protein
VVARRAVAAKTPDVSGRVVVQTVEHPTASWRRWWQWLLRPCPRDEAVVGCGRKDGEGEHA